MRAYFSVQGERHRAVSDLSFEIERGEAVGFIGENGAGKSTTIKMLTGILSPTSGQVRTLGMDPWRERKHLSMNIGVVFGQKPQLLWDIPAGESFKLLRMMYRIPDEVYRFTFHESVARLELGDLLSTPVRLLSLGQRMRCDLAASLLHAPAVAFLDEPTIGMDVLVKERVRELLNEMRSRFGTTVLLTTHDLKDISTTCERLLVLDKGKLLYDGGLAGFEKRFAAERVVKLQLAREPDADTVSRFEGALMQLGASAKSETPRLWHITCSQPGTTPRVTALALQHLDVEDLALHGEEIDTVVARLYRENLGDAS